MPTNAQYIRWAAKNPPPQTWYDERNDMATNEQKIEVLILAVKTLCDEIQRVRNNLCDAGDSATCERIRDSMNALTKIDDQPATAEKPNCDHSWMRLDDGSLECRSCKARSQPFNEWAKETPPKPAKCEHPDWVSPSGTLAVHCRLCKAIGRLRGDGSPPEWWPDQNYVALKCLKDIRRELMQNHSYHLIHTALLTIDAKIASLGANQ